MKKMIGQPQYIKEVNIDLVEDIIAEKGPISKPEISRLTSLSLPTVNKIVDALQEKNKVKASGVFGSGAGRKAQLYVVNEKSGCIFALYFMNDSYICSIVNAIGEMTYKCTIPVDTTLKSAALKSTFNAIDKLMDHTESDVKAIGIGVPGVVNNNNKLSSIPTIPEWEGINLKQLIEEKYNISVFVENDVKLTTVGFYHNELKQKYDSMIYIYLGKGIGSGIIINGKLYKGFKSFAGELGYMIVENPSEAGKAYIQRGLLEQKTSTLIQNLQDSSYPEESKRADREQLTRLLAFGITNLVCTLNPEVIVLSSDIVNKQLITELEHQVSFFIDGESMPVFMTNNSGTSGIFGIVNMCISNISSKFQLVKGKGV